MWAGPAGTLPLLIPLLTYCAITGAVAKGGETHNANVYGVWTIGIPSNSQNKELATELLSYLMDKDVQKSTVPSGGVPCRYSSLQDAEILKTILSMRSSARLWKAVCIVRDR